MYNIAPEFESARSKFPALQQIGNLSFSITFPEVPGNNYTITLNQEHPKQAPTVTLNNKPLDLPIISSWMEVFRLEHIVSQLQAHSRVPASPKHSVNEAELQKALANASYEELSNLDNNSQLFQNMDCIKRSNQEYQNAVQAGQKDADELMLVQTQAIDLASFVRETNDRLNILKREIEGLNPNSPQRMNIAYQNKANQLRADAAAIENSINQLNNAFNSQQIRPEDYFKELSNLKEKMYTSQFTADELCKQQNL